MVGDTDLGIALIGCGGMATHYRNNYTHIPGTAYRLIVDVKADLAKNVAEELQVPRFSTDWRTALSDDIQIVDISTPNHLHTEQAVALLRAGKHVILQKPMAPTVAECYQIVEAARQSQCQAGVYMSDLEDPVVWDIRDIVQHGYIGRVTGARGRYAHRGGMNARPSESYWRGSADKTGGGSFIQLSIHHTNLLSWVLEDRIESVMGYARNLLCPHIEGDDTAACVVEFSRTGVIALFDSAWNAEGTTFEIYGSEGTVKMLGGQGSAVQVQLNRAYSGRVLQVADSNLVRLSASGSMPLHCRPENPLNQHIAFVNAVRAGKPFPMDAEVGLYDVAVVKAVYLSSELGRRVSVAEVMA
jgi:predicted dehydrogenase